ncbi:MAG TPA: hypothetical protein VIH04_04715 [Nitrosarchaeum sp.]
MVRKTIELNEHYYSKLKKIAKIENRKKVEDIWHLTDCKFASLGLEDGKA